MNIYLHIGRHKTGTTSIQYKLSNEFDRLKSRGILYPKIGRIGASNINHHSLFVDNFNKRKSEIFLDKDKFSDLKIEIKSSKCKHIIISSEVLSRNSVTTEFLKCLKEEFNDYNVKVVVFLREPFDFVSSVYAERIKKGLVSSFRPLDLATLNLDYFGFVEKYGNVFGKKNILIAEFKPLSQKNLINEFMLELKLDYIFNSDAKKDPRNVRLGKNYLKFLFYINNIPFGNRLFSNSFIKNPLNTFLNKLPSSNQIYDDNIVKTYLERINNVEKLYKEYGFSPSWCKSE